MKALVVLLLAMADCLETSLVILVLCGIMENCFADWHLLWEDEFEGGNLSERYNFETGCNG